MNKSDKINFESELRKALKAYGYGFPETIKEVEQFEQEVPKADITLPPLKKPSEILKSKKVKRYKYPHRLKVDHSIAQNMAQAAREGKTISDATKKKMLKDRKQAEENQED